MSIVTSLFAAQQDMPDLQKNAINPHFRNTYITLDALLDAVLPVLTKHGILLLQLPSMTPTGQPALTTMFVEEETGEKVESAMPLILEKDTPQGQGSAITYARRYMLMSALGLVADEDDDAEAASKQDDRKATKSESASGLKSGF